LKGTEEYNATHPNLARDEIESPHPADPRDHLESNNVLLETISRKDYEKFNKFA
jgi:hypothetical protein